MQRKVGVDNSDKRDIRKMQTFRDHLGADEDVDLAGTKGMQRFAVSVFARHRIGIHSPNDCFGEDRGNVRLHFFGAESGVDERVLAALRTALWHRRAMAAEVTAETRVGAVEGEGDAAVRAVARLPAVAAKERGGETA